MLHYDAYQHLINNKDSYLFSSGWIDSLKNKKPLDSLGQPIPWMNYAVIDLLNEKLNKELTLFEFGSGYSTHFYANKVKFVTSLEYDKTWFDLISSDLPSNTKFHFIAKDVDGLYCRAIQSSQSRYDIVVIDGRDRVNCLRQSLSCLSSSGVIILDDSHRGRYTPAIDLVYEHGYRCLNLSGLKPTGTGRDQTTIIYKDGNCLGI